MQPEVQRRSSRLEARLEQPVDPLNGAVGRLESDQPQQQQLHLTPAVHRCLKLSLQQLRVQQQEHVRQPERQTQPACPPTVAAGHSKSG